MCEGSTSINNTAEGREWIAWSPSLLIFAQPIVPYLVPRLSGRIPRVDLQRHALRSYPPVRRVGGRRLRAAVDSTRYLRGRRCGGLSRVWFSTIRGPMQCMRPGQRHSDMSGFSGRAGRHGFRLRLGLLFRKSENCSQSVLDLPAALLTTWERCLLERLTNAHQNPQFLFPVFDGREQRFHPNPLCCVDMFCVSMTLVAARSLERKELI
jgi:hypothetical protein